MHRHQRSAVIAFLAVWKGTSLAAGGGQLTSENDGPYL
jgi:hypothetical protein